MRIAIDARPLEASRTGVGRTIEGLLPSWLGLFPEDSFVLLSPRPVHLPTRLDGLAEVRASRTSLPGTVWLHAFAGQEAERAGADVFYGTLGVLPLRLSLPGVVTIHDLTPILFPKWHPLRNRLGFRPFLASTVARSRALFAVSEATRRDLVARHPEAASRCFVVPNGLVPVSGPSRDLPPPNDGRPYVLFLGTREPRKNLDRLVIAMERLWDGDAAFPDLVVAGGEGWGMDGFEARVARSRHPGRVRLLGWVEPERASQLLRAARLLAYPSLYEGFGLPVLEAMALNTVVVASSSSSLPEVVGDAGLLPDPTDVSAIAAALRKAESDETFRAEARRRGLDRARLFTWEKAAEAMRPRFEEAVR